MIKQNRKSLIIFGAAFFAFCFVLSRVSRAPVIYPDEAGYIGWAYKMIYGKGDGLRYLPGYSLLLAPILAVFKDIHTAYPVITAVNAVMMGVFASLVLKLCYKTGSKHPILTASCVCLYPSYALYVDLALCEALLTLLFAILVLLVGRLCKNINKPSRWIGVLAVVSYMCITHSRAIALLPALVLTLWPFVIKKGTKATKRAFFGIIAVMAVCATALFFLILSKNDNVNATHLLSQVKNVFTLSGITAFLGTVVSQFTYMIFSTYGFVIIGVYYCIRGIKRNENRGIALFSLLAFVFALLLSAMFMYHHEQPNQALYGRYTEHTLWAILIFGISGFLKSGARIILAIPGILAAVFTGLAYSSHMAGLEGNLFSNWGIHAFGLLLFKFEYWEFAAIFFVIALILYAVSRKSRKWTVILLSLCFVLCICHVQYSYFYKGTTLRREVPQLAVHLSNEVSVAADGEGGDFEWDCYNYLVYNPLLEYDNSANNLLLSSNRQQGLTLVGVEKNSHTYLYSRFLDKRVEIDESGSPFADISLKSAKDGQIVINITNLGRPWLCSGAAEDITKAVRAGMRVYKEGTLLEDARADFSDNLYLYTEAEVSFAFPYEDGVYTVVFEAIREFFYRTSPLSLEITVDGGQISYKETDQIPSPPDWSISPENFPTAKGFYRYYVTPQGAEIDGIFLEGDLLVLETFGEADRLDVTVRADGEPLVLREYKDGNYYFELFGTAKSLEIESETYAYSDNSLTFLTTESNWKPIDAFVRGMKKIFDIRLDHRQRGVDIKKVYTRKE